MTKFTCIRPQERGFSNLLKYLRLLLHIKPHRKLFSIFFSTFEKVGSPLIDNIYKKICRTSSLVDVFSATFFAFQGVLKTSWRHICKTSCKHVLKTSWRRLQEVLEDEKCYAEDVVENKKCLLGYFKINLVVFFDLKLDSHLSKKYFICFNESTLKTIKNAFYFILKALFVLKKFKFLS